MTTLLPGDAAPWFTAPALDGNPRFVFDQVGGRAIVLLFYGSMAWPPSSAALEVLARHRALFDDEQASFFGVGSDPADAASGRIKRSLPGVRWFLDYDTAIARAYGAVESEGETQRFHPYWLLLDPTLRVVDRAPIAEGERIMAALRRLLDAPPEQSFAPVLTVPRVLEPDLCRRLIGLYDRHGGSESGFMLEVDGMTRTAADHGVKRRSDYVIDDAELRAQIAARMRRFLLPQIRRAFQFEVSRVERYIVGCYDGDNGGGYFRAHRDNTTKGTAHRRFACTINLNADDYEGGDLVFAEYGRRTYRAPTGGAVVFSCSLLHEATPVTRGRRYAFLPFFYDEEGARIRAENAAFVAKKVPDAAEA